MISPDCQVKQVKKGTKCRAGRLDNPPGGLLQNRPMKPEEEKRIIFVLGGDRSGKSRYALSRAELFSPRAFIATALPVDAEMKTRIAAHRAERGSAFRTVEAPYDLAGALKRLPPDTKVAVVDCLTVWLGNLFFKYGETLEGAGEIDAFYEALRNPPCALVIVSNEIGLGIVPADGETRRFRDMMGGVNQRVAALADEAVFMISGLPLRLKG